VLSEPDDDELPHVDPFASRGRPGTRAPHVVLERDSGPLSTLDLFGRNFVLLAGAEGEAWCAAARASGVDAHRIGGAGDLADPDGKFPDAYGIGSSGAVLVRPDGFVAWRDVDRQADAQRVLGDVMERLLRPPGSRSPGG
jgi:putative polyketide hydroxylase